MAPLRLFRIPALLLLLMLAPGGAAVGLAASAQEWNAQGVELLQRGEYLQALEPLRRAREALPYNDTIRGNLAEAYFALGLHLLESHRFEEAAEIFAEGRDHDEEAVRFPLYRGYALLLAGDRLEAEEALYRALDMEGENPQVHRLLGRLHYEAGRLFEAQQAWRTAQELAPGDRELAALLAKVARELEVEERMRRNFGGNFSIAWHGEAADDLGGEVLEVLQDAYREIGYDLNVYPETVVPVLLYTDREFAELTSSPDWAGGLYDGKIRIPFGGVETVGPRVKALLYHEYSHVAVRSLTHGNCPVWLDEGLAVLAGGRHDQPPGEALADAAEKGALFTPERLQRSFRDLSREEARLAYLQSFTMVRYLVETYGWYAVGEVLTALGRGEGIAEAVDGALAPYGAGYAQLLSGWQAGGGW